MKRKHLRRDYRCLNTQPTHILWRQLREGSHVLEFFFFFFFFAPDLRDLRVSNGMSGGLKKWSSYICKILCYCMFFINNTVHSSRRARYLSVHSGRPGRCREPGTRRPEIQDNKLCIRTELPSWARRDSIAGELESLPLTHSFSNYWSKGVKGIQVVCAILVLADGAACSESDTDEARLSQRDN